MRKPQSVIAIVSFGIACWDLGDAIECVFKRDWHMLPADVAAGITLILCAWYWWDGSVKK